MHRTEREEAVRCVACGANVWIERERGYAFGERRALCFDCALERGGTYDAARDVWTTPPATLDLEGVD